MGSGFSDALNLVTTSEHYNKIEMGDAEKELERQLSLEEESYKRNGRASFITFDLVVTANYIPIRDNSIIEELRSATQLGDNGEQKEELLKVFHAKLARNKDPMYCKEVDYRVIKVRLKNSTGLDIKEKGSTIRERVGQDIHFKEIL